MRRRQWFCILLALLLAAGTGGMASAVSFSAFASLEDTDIVDNEVHEMPQEEEALPEDEYVSESMGAGAGLLIPTLERTFEGAFSDVNGQWYEDAVRTVYETGLMDGRSDGTFGASATLMVPHVVTITARFHSRLTGGDGDIPDTPRGSAVPAARSITCIWPTSWV